MAIGKHDVWRRFFLAAGLGLAGAGLLAGAGCAPAPFNTASGVAADAITERVIPGKSVI